MNRVRRTNLCWTLSPVHRGCWETLLGSWSSGTGQPEHCSETHTKTHTHSLFHTLDSSWWITWTFWDLIKVRMGRLLCEVITDNSRHSERRKESMMREKRETRKHHQELSGDGKKKKINVPFFSSIWFIFPARPFTTGGRRGKVGGSEKEKGQKKEMTPIHENSEHLTSQITPDNIKEPICPQYYSACLWTS